MEHQEMHVVHGTAQLNQALGVERMAGNAVVVESPPGFGKSELAWAITRDETYTANMQDGFDPDKLAPEGPQVREIRVGLYEDYDFPGPLYVDRSDVLRTHLHPTLESLHYGDTLLIEEIKLKGANKVAMMLLEGRFPRVGHWTGPEHVFRLGLANGVEDGALECIDNAVVGNRHAHIRWTGPTPKERVQWGLDNRENPIVVAAIKMEGDELIKDYDPTRMRNSTPRSLHNAARAMDALERWHRANGSTPTHAERVQTLARHINDAAALKIAAVFALRDKLIPFSAILSAPGTAPIPEDPASMMMLCSNVGNKTTPQNFDDVMRYVSRLPLETQGAIVDPVLKRHPELHATTTAQQYHNRTSDLRRSS
jgi:hypothetical protein